MVYRHYAYLCRELVILSAHFISVLLTAGSTQCDQIYRTLLKVIVHKSIPDRPGRSEPRVRKRRPKSYPVDEATQKPLAQAIADCLIHNRFRLS